MSDKPNDPTEKEMGGPSSVSESDTCDGEFEPTAEMMVNDFDDERTLEEEELMETGDSPGDEVNNLNEEQNMPMEQLLAIYGALPHASAETQQQDSEIGENGEAADSMEVEDLQMESRQAEDASPSSDCSATVTEKEIHMEDEKSEKKKSDLSHLYSELDTNGDSGGNASARSLRSCSRHPSEDEYEEGEDVSGEEEEDWRKTIMIGSLYQAQVPEGLQKYGATPPYENKDKLLWSPEDITCEKVEKYLALVGAYPPEMKGMDPIPMGAHTRDNEQALYLLYKCCYNMEEALRRHRMEPCKIATCMTLWSEDECRNFENGVKQFGKDFHQIQEVKVRTRSVGELVQFYYLWKKTERHDLFIAKSRIEKKKYFVHPGTTDYMDRFLDDGDSNLAGSGAPTSTRGENRSDSPGGMHVLLYGNCPRGVQAPMSSTNVATSMPHGSAIQPSGEATRENTPSNPASPARVLPAPNPSGDSSQNRIDGTASRNLSNSNSRSNHTLQMPRGVKRPHSPGPVGVNVSIAHSLSVRGNSSTIGMDPALGKAGAVAL